MQFGLLLPHFGEHASRSKVIDGAQMAEELGFDSVWVRDHLIFHPHGMEGTDRTFYEAFLTLGAISSVTRRLILGTGTVIPFRHPIHLAQQAAILSFYSGGRVILGFGAGNFDHEFEAIGLGGVFRPDLVRENVQILRKLWTEDHVSFHGQFYRFEDVELHPKPVKPIPVWYGGNTPASARRAVEYCDGWMPGRITLTTFKKRMEQMRKLSQELGRPMPTTGCIPITSIGKDLEAAVSKVNLPGLLKNANKQKWWVRPPHGEFRTVDDLEGSVLFGSPDDIVREVLKYYEAGLEHLVFDFRFRFDEFFEQVKLLGTEVLPRLREEIARRKRAGVSA